MFYFLNINLNDVLLTTIHIQRPCDALYSLFVCNHNMTIYIMPNFSYKQVINFQTLVDNLKGSGY